MLLPRFSAAALSQVNGFAGEKYRIAGRYTGIIMDALEKRCRRIVFWLCSLKLFNQYFLTMLEFQKLCVAYFYYRLLPNVTVIIHCGSVFEKIPHKSS